MIKFLILHLTKNPYPFLSYKNYRYNFQKWNDGDGNKSTYVENLVVLEFKAFLNKKYFRVCMLKICLQEHLLMTFSYTSKAARDMMRLYAPKKHRSKKQGGRKVQPVILFTFTIFFRSNNIALWLFNIYWPSTGNNFIALWLSNLPSGFNI